jgi:signal transduction histidine kinase
VTAERLQLLGQLSGGLAHQLRNSIAGARMAIQLHQRRCTADDPMVGTALAQLALTEEQVLAVVSLRPDGSQTSPQTNCEPCDLSRMVADVVALLQSHCTHWKSVLSVDVPETLPVSLVSAQGLKGALLNLMQNAIEAAGVDGTIRCELKKDDEKAVIDIRDSGPGFTDDQQMLLTAFRTTKPEGIGLGLTIAQHAVEQEGGSLTFRRIDDQTSVQIRLPLTPHRQQ